MSSNIKSKIIDPLEKFEADHVWAHLGLCGSSRKGKKDKKLNSNSQSSEGDIRNGKDSNTLPI